MQSLFHALVKEKSYHEIAIQRWARLCSGSRRLNASFTLMLMIEERQCKQCYYEAVVFAYRPVVAESSYFVVEELTNSTLFNVVT